MNVVHNMPGGLFVLLESKSFARYKKTPPLARDEVISAVPLY